MAQRKIQWVKIFCIIDKVGWVASEDVNIEKKVNQITLTALF